MGFAVPAEQVAVMFLLMALGWAAHRLKWLRGDAIHGVTNIVLYFVTPAVIIQAFQRPFDIERLRQLGVMFGVDVAVFALTVGIATLFFNRRLVPDAARRIALRYGTVYPNAGFMGIPLVQALLGDDGVVFAVCFIAVFHFFVWTHGEAVWGTRERGGLRAELRHLARNPNLIAIAAALVLFLLPWRIPSPVSDVLGHLSVMNAPLSMLVIGASLAGIDLRTIFREPLAWLGMGVRNLVVPLVFLGLFTLLPLDPVARLATLIQIACPVAAFLVMFALRHGADTHFPSQVMTLSTLFSVLTLPGVLMLAAAVW